MASEIYLVLGVFLIIAIASDFFYTTVSFNGAGILSRTISKSIAAIFLWVNRKTDSRVLFKFSGMTHILALVIAWIGLLWLGLFLLLMSDPSSVLHAPSQTAASAANKFYFSGYVLSTLGNGQYIPNGKSWQLIVAAFSFAGFIFITTAMTYLMNLTSAVIHKRELSLFISNLGETPEEILSNSYNGTNFKWLTRLAPDLQQMINEHSQNHYAHPGVHYFYSIPRDESLSVNLTNLDEVITLLETRVKNETLIDDDLRPLRNAIDKFLHTIQNHFINTPNLEIECEPDFQHLKQSGISIDNELFKENRTNKRRILLSGLLQSSGWSWKDIYKQGQNKKQTNKN